MQSTKIEENTIFNKVGIDDLRRRHNFGLLQNLPDLRRHSFDLLQNLQIDRQILRLKFMIILLLGRL